MISFSIEIYENALWEGRIRSYFDSMESNANPCFDGNQVVESRTNVDQICLQFFQTADYW